MSLLKKAESYKLKMEPRLYKTFISLVKQSVDLNAKNTKNRKCKDLAEHLIEDLAAKWIKPKLKESDFSISELKEMTDEELFNLFS